MDTVKRIRARSKFTATPLMHFTSSEISAELPNSGHHSMETEKITGVHPLSGSLSIIMHEFFQKRFAEYTLNSAGEKGPGASAADIVCLWTFDPRRKFKVGQFALATAPAIQPINHETDCLGFPKVDQR